MAISVSGEKRNIGSVVWIIVAVVAVIILLATMYYLFFAPAPFIDVVVPPALEDISQYSDADFDTSVLERSEVFQSLRRHVSEPELGEFGRENPFTRF